MSVNAIRLQQCSCYGLVLYELVADGSSTGPTGKTGKMSFSAVGFNSPQRQERKLTSKEATRGSERCKTGVSESDRQVGSCCFPFER